MTLRRTLGALVFALAALASGSAAAYDVKALDAVDGAQVWFSEDHTVPIVALTASFPAGSAYDPSAKAGLAAFASALLDEGAGPLDGAAFQAALANNAIQLDADPDRDDMVVTIVTLSSNAKEAFHLLSLALLHPRFDAAAVARVRLQMLQGIEEDKEDPEAVAEKGFYSFYYGPYAYGHPVDGDPRGLKAITIADLQAFARSHWVRGGLKVAIAGDLDDTAATALVRSSFGSLPANAPPPPPAPGLSGAPGLHILPMTVPQPTVAFGLPGLRRNNPDFMAAMIANYILGGGDTSRLDTAVREDRGLAYSVSTDLVAMQKAGLVLGEVATRRDAVRRTIEVVRDTMRRFAADGPTDEEITDAKTYLNGSFPLAFSSNADTAAQLNAIQRMGLPLDYLGRRADLIDAVTTDDVRRVARQLFDPSKMTIVVAGTLPEEKTQAPP